MNLLRNKIVTGALALAAVTVVFFQAGGAKLFRAGPKASPVVAAAAQPTTTLPRSPAPTAAVISQPAGPGAARTGTDGSLASAVLTNTGIDREFAAAHYKAWVSEGRLRDPFRLIQPAAEEPGLSETATNSPVASWKLKAIWNQTGSRLAVINDSVYRVGDEIQGYRILRIENDEVWFQGPDRKERLGFESPQKAPAKSTANGRKPGDGVPPNGNLTA